MGNDFPKLGINTQELIDACEALIEKAREEVDDTGWGVNWGDIGVRSIEYRKEMMDANSKPYCAVTIEEASPTSHLAGYIYNGIKDRFPDVQIECEW